MVNGKGAFINLRTVNEKSVRDLKGNLSAVEGVGDVPITVELKDGKSAAITPRNAYTCQIIKSTFFPSAKQLILSTDSSLTTAEREW